eukprot:scaffold860_cov111-Cylindrotheca_fusiformis.AAC.8
MSNNLLQRLRKKRPLVWTPIMCRVVPDFYVCIFVGPEDSLSSRCDSSRIYFDKECETWMVDCRMSGV